MTLCKKKKKDGFHNVTFLCSLRGGVNPSSVLKWKLTELSGAFLHFYKETLMSPDERCCDESVSVEEITSALCRYKRCGDMTTVFDAIFDYANAPNK